jgi:methylenetetrahydrofolate/methylenetetrahydromethanopterin dehydrogenase (NADP+)
MASRVLIQLDPDPQPSTFDAIVAIDSGVDTLLRHGSVTPEASVPLVHGAMFTRGGGELASTAIFVGGSDVTAAEAVFRKVRETFFGPVRVGVMLDPSGANTTAAAAVVTAARHAVLAESHAVVLGATGPVGRRVAGLLAGRAGSLTVCSRSLERAEALAGEIAARRSAAVQAVSLGGSLAESLAEAAVVISAGAAGVTLLDAAGLKGCRKARVLIDLNAVPPVGIEGILPSDKARVLEGIREDLPPVAYGPLGVGGTKMKIHRAAIDELFVSTEAALDAEEILAIAWRLEGDSTDRG